MLPVLLFNVISGLVMDKAQDLAKEHVEAMIDSIIPDDAKEELDVEEEDESSLRLSKSIADDGDDVPARDSFQNFDLPAAGGRLAGLRSRA